MAIKAYTDLEQSKKLAEILPSESADLYWKNGVSNKYIQCLTPFVINDYRANVEFDYDVPCWSLAALLNIIPKHIKEYNTLRIDIGEKAFSIWYDEIGCGVNTELPDITMESTVDACVQMIIKLNELNLF